MEYISSPIFDILKRNFFNATPVIATAPRFAEGSGLVLHQGQCGCPSRWPGLITGGRFDSSPIFKKIINYSLFVLLHYETSPFNNLDRVSPLDYFKVTCYMK
jgi:hypothetical protein